MTDTAWRCLRTPAPSFTMPAMAAVTAMEPTGAAALALPRGAVDPIAADALRAHRPDLHLAVTDPLRARCSLWWTEVPALPDERLGVIGHYAAADGESSAALLSDACARLRAHGCTRAVGPMDGNTWRRYRFVTATSDEPAFALEPENPREYPGQWLAAGFSPMHTYSSSLVPAYARDPRCDTVEARLAAEGVSIRPFDRSAFADELGRIYAVSEIAFRANVLYTPLAREDFIAQYRPIEALVRPELALIAEQDGAPCGFVFAIPDLARTQRGQRVDTVVVKTLAVLPDCRQAGLGRTLVDRCHRAAAALGMPRAIHALMHDANPSRSIGAGAQVIRRYTLFSQALR